jgi:hypothetical protein
VSRCAFLCAFVVDLHDQLQVLWPCESLVRSADAWRPDTAGRAGLVMAPQPSHYLAGKEPRPHTAGGIAGAWQVS